MDFGLSKKLIIHQLMSKQAEYPSDEIVLSSMAP